MFQGLRLAFVTINQKRVAWGTSITTGLALANNDELYGTFMLKNV